MWWSSRREEGAAPSAREDVAVSAAHADVSRVVPRRDEACPPPAGAPGSAATTVARVRASAREDAVATAAHAGVSRVVPRRDEACPPPAATPPSTMGRGADADNSDKSDIVATACTPAPVTDACEGAIPAPQTPVSRTISRVEALCASRVAALLVPPPAASAAATTGRVPRGFSAPEQRPPALASHVSTRATPPIGPRLSPDVDRDAISPTGSSTMPETAVGAPFGSRRPARHGDPSARVPNTDTDDVPTDTRTPRAPMDTARSRHASAVYPFAMPPRSRRGHSTPSRCPRPSVADTRAPPEEAPAAWFSREAS